MKRPVLDLGASSSASSLSSVTTETLIGFGLERKGRYHANGNMLSLLRWLGPWNDGRTPRGVRRETTDLGDGQRTFRYTPTTRPRGAYVVVPGMHPDGPADPRLDRFCRLLAASGFLVDAPLLRHHLRLRLSPETPADLVRALTAFAPAVDALGLPPPALFSISFGSLPAIIAAAEHPSLVSGLALFGGFADFDAAIRYAVTGSDGQATPDPLNRPALFLNFLPHLDLGNDLGRVEWGWLTMVRRTWGRPELKLEGARDGIAHELAAHVPARHRELFLIGCGLAPGGEALLDRVLPLVATAHADPRPHLGRLTRPVLIAHGRDDDVIPVRQADELARALPAGLPRRVCVTGLYGHTGSARPTPGAIAGELRTMLSLVRALDRLPRGGLG